MNADERLLGGPWVSGTGEDIALAHQGPDHVDVVLGRLRAHTPIQLDRFPPVPVSGVEAGDHEEEAARHPKLPPPRVTRDIPEQLPLSLPSQEVDQPEPRTPGLLAIVCRQRY